MAKMERTDKRDRQKDTDRQSENEKSRVSEDLGRRWIVSIKTDGGAENKERHGCRQTELGVPLLPEAPHVSRGPSHNNALTQEGPGGGPFDQQCVNIHHLLCDSQDAPQHKIYVFITQRARYRVQIWVLGVQIYSDYTAQQLIA